MQSQEQQIIDLIQLMKTEQVVQAEQKLMSMTNNIDFMGKIFHVIQNQQLEPWIRTIASSFLNKVITEKLQQFGYKSMFTAISNITRSYDITPNDKRCFESSIISLIEYIKQPEEIEEWRQFILQHINDYKLFDTGLLLIDCTAIAEISTDYLCMIIEDTFELTLSKCEVSLQNAAVLNELIKCWIVVLDKLTAIENEETVDLLLVKMTTSGTLAKLLFKIFEFNAPQEIWLCVNPQLYELNLLKYEAAELTKKISEYVISNHLPAEQCHCIQLILQSYSKIKNTVAVVGSSPNLEVMEVYQCEDFITSMLSLLVIYVKTVGEFPEEEMNILQHIVCFPFLKTRQQQMYMFEESPQEFNTLAEDLCDKQTFGVLKTEAARLLQTISDHSKSAMQKSIIFCIECIKMNIGYIPKYENNEIKILDVETAFQILAIYSFSLEQYPQELEKLKVILCDKRMMEVQPIVLSKIFLLLAYNYEEIFKNPQDGSFWIEFAIGYKSHPTTRYMALDFISNIVDEYFTPKLFEQIVHLIIDSNEKQTGLVWNIVRKLFDNQKPQITEQQCLGLVNTVFKRIEMQFSLLQSKDKESTQDVINAIHVLRKIVQDKEYLSNKQSLKTRVLDITVIFQKTIALDLDDEVIKILIEYVNNYLTIGKEKILSLLPLIEQQFKKDDYYQNSYFILFNQCIVNFRFNEIKPIIKTLLSGMMFHLFDMSENAKKRKMKIAIANILTLLQNLLSVHGYEMSGTQDDCMCEIGAMCIRLFPSEQNEKIFSKPLLAKALNLMFICHLYSKTQNTLEYLLRYGKQGVFHGYDAYVIVKLLSKAIFAQQNPHIVIEQLKLMIQVANQYEKNEKKGMSIKTAKGKLKIKRQQQLSNILFNITSPFINFDYSKSKKHLPVKNEVIECITKMKSQNLDTYKLIVMNMTEDQKAQLSNIVNQKAQVEGKQRVIRKIVGVKSTSNNANNQNDDSDIDENDEEGSSSFKRKRVLMKKNQGKKKKEGDSINVQ